MTKEVGLKKEKRSVRGEAKDCVTDLTDLMALTSLVRDCITDLTDFSTDSKSCEERHLNTEQQPNTLKF